MVFITTANDHILSEWQIQAVFGGTSIKYQREMALSVELLVSAMAHFRFGYTRNTMGGM
jgi:hypothetical protein